MLFRQALSSSSRSLSSSARRQQPDLLQNVFVQKIRQYAEKQKAAPDGLVDSNAEVQRQLNEALTRLTGKYHLASAADVSKLPLKFKTANVESAIEPLLDQGVKLDDMLADVSKEHKAFMDKAKFENEQQSKREKALAGGEMPEHVPEGMVRYMAEHGVKWPLEPPELMAKISGEELVNQIAWEEQAQAHLPLEMVRDIDGNKVLQKMLDEPEKMRRRLTSVWDQLPWRQWHKKPYIPDLCYRDDDGTPHTNNRIAHWFQEGQDRTKKLGGSKKPAGQIEAKKPDATHKTPPGGGDKKKPEEPKEPKKPPTGDPNTPKKGGQVPVPPGKKAQ